MRARIPPAAAVLLLTACLLCSGCMHTTRGPAGTPAPPSPHSPTAFNESEIRYFQDVALGYEYSSSPRVVYRWVKTPVVIRTIGDPDPESLSCLDSVITDFNTLSPAVKLLHDNAKDPDITIFFVPEREFPRYESHYVPVNMGWLYTWYHPGDCSLYQGTILISTTGISAPERCHLIREELTQSMGLAVDSGLYPDGIFYREWTRTTAYSDIDARIITMLYASGIPSCSDRETARMYFNGSPVTQ